MSMQAINYALTLPVDESGPRLALILIAHHINWKTGDMFVSQDELSKEVRCSERTIRRYLEQLIEAGFITRDKRTENDGRRATDRIALVGYLEWQEVVYNGGTIPDPKTRGKPIKTPPDKLAAGEPATGQMVSSPPDKNGSATGQQVSGIKEPLLNHKINPSSAIDLDLKGKRAAGFGSFTVTASDPQWQAWIDHLRERDPTAADDALAAGVIQTAGSRWPGDGVGYAIKKPAPGLTDRSHAMTGDRG